MNLFKRDDKKVEYIELIYDLVFVYMVGRNNALLHHFEGGFVAPVNMMAYVMCTLAIIQIWNFTTFYINMFGRNSARDHVCLFINMYLMYFIGEATRTDFAPYQAQYHIAWALILINIGVQYLIELRNHQADVWNRDIIKRMALALFAEAAVVLIAAFTSMSLSIVLSALAIAVGVGLTSFGKFRSPGGSVDFMHLTERAMLYVVFTFGEMIITIATYFKGDGSFDPSVIYFSLMGFLIVAGLFLSYGLYYDHLLDREREDNGLLYMILHIFIIFALNNITASLEFMRMEEVALMPKMVFIVGSVIAYYLLLFIACRYSKVSCRLSRTFDARLAAVTVVFAVLMIAFKDNMYINIFITVAYVYTIVAAIYRSKVWLDSEE